MKVISAEFVTSAAPDGHGAGIPQDGIPQVALVGRSNVGKSTLINALCRRPVARTSAAPGKTRLANVYRVSLEGSRPGRWRLYLVDLPGYGFARGGAAAAEELKKAAEGYFASRGSGLGARDSGMGGSSTRAQTSATAAGKNEPRAPNPEPRHKVAALLLADSRHPGLSSDRQALEWFRTMGIEPLVVATKVDKLSRTDRVKNLRELERTFGRAVLPVSALRGEGLDELWRRLAKLVKGTKEAK